MKSVETTTVQSRRTDLRRLLSIAALAVFAALVVSFGAPSLAAQHSRDGPTLGLVSTFSSVETNLLAPLSNSSAVLTSDSSSTLTTVTNAKDATWTSYLPGSITATWFGASTAVLLLLMGLVGAIIVTVESGFGRFTNFVKRSFDQLGGAAVRHLLKPIGSVAASLGVLLFAMTAFVSNTSVANAGNGGYLGQSDSNSFPAWALIALALGSVTLVLGGLITRRAGK